MLLNSAALAARAAACDGAVSPAGHVRASPWGAHPGPARDLSQSQHSPFQHVYKADPETRAKPPESSLLRATEVHTQLLSFRNWSEDSRKCFSDRVHSEMSYILILPQHDSSSWTDLTSLLKPAIRPGHFLPSWHYFRQQRHGAPAPVAGAATEGNLYKPSFVPTAQLGMPGLRQEPVSVSRGAGGDSEARQPQEGNISPSTFSAHPGAALWVCGWPHSPGRGAAGGIAKNSSPALLILEWWIRGEEEKVLGVIANLVHHVGMQM